MELSLTDVLDALRKASVTQLIKLREDILSTATPEEIQTLKNIELSNIPRETGFSQTKK